MDRIFELAGDEAGGLSSLFSLLSDETRVRLVVTLAAGEASVGQLQRRLALPQPTVSHHLTILRTGHLVVARRGGKQVFYSLGGRVRAAAGAIHISAGDLCVRLTRGSSVAVAESPKWRGEPPPDDRRPAARCGAAPHTGHP